MIKKELGTLYAWSSKWKNAERELEEYLKRVPTDVEALELLGDTYLYDGKYQKAKATYKTIFDIDPLLEPQYRERMQEIRLHTSSYLAYIFSYYKESNEKFDYKSTSLEHEWDWYQYVNDRLYLVTGYGMRIDDTLYKRTPIYPAGFVFKMFEQSWLSMIGRFEKDRSINPAYRLRTIFSTVPKDRYVLSIGQDTEWYWDGNISYSGELDLSRAFLKDRSLILLWFVRYDQIKHPSPYFVRIRPPDEPGERLRLGTTGLTLDKSFKINDRLELGLGGTTEVNTDSDKIFTGFVRAVWKLFNNVNLNATYAYGHDTEHYDYSSAYVYTTIVF